MSKKCTQLWREAHFQVKMYKTHHVRTTFGGWYVEKVHAVVARSTFASEKHLKKPQCRTTFEVVMSKKCTPLWREAYFEVNMYKTTQYRNAFGSWDVEKVHAVVARSTCPSQNVQNTSVSDHFWKLTCRKSARRRGAKHMSKSKCTKNIRFGPLWKLRFEMSKKCTPLWRAAHVQVKMYKTPQYRTTFGSWDVEKVHTVVARSTCPSQNAENTPAPDHFWKLRCRKSVRRCGAKHMSKSKVEKLKGLEHFWTFGYRCTWHAQGILHLPKSGKNWGLWQFQVQPLHYTTLHYTTLHCTTATTTTTHQLQVQLQPQLQLQLQLQLHYATLHYTKYTTLHSTSLHCTTFNYPMLHYNYITATTITTTTTTLRYTSYTALH